MEEKIIKWLKANRTRGVAFSFMPRKVQAWAIDHLGDIDIYDGTQFYKFDDDFIASSDIITLSENYPIVTEDKPGKQTEETCISLTEKDRQEILDATFELNTDNDEVTPLLYCLMKKKVIDEKAFYERLESEDW